MSLVVAILVMVGASEARASVPWAWPVTGAIVRGFDPPDSPYGAGHRGIDIAAVLQTVVLAPDNGIVTFAGKVGGRLFLTIDHGGGLTSTSSWLTSVLVRKGDRVVRGQPVATTGWGHADLSVPHLHFGVRLDGAYVDPLAYLEPPSVSTLIRLAPLGDPAPLVATGRMTSLAYPTTSRARAAARRDSHGRTGDRGDITVGVATVPGWRRPRGRRPCGAGAPVPCRLERARRYR
jgi:Peptidase family M23